MNSRRSFLKSSSAIGAGAALVALGACQATSSSTSLQTFVTAISNGLSGILTDITAIPGVVISPATMTSIQNELNILASDASQIGSVVTSSSAGTVQAISAAVTALVPLVTPFFAGAPFVATAIQAALALLPTILAMVSAPAPAGVAPKMTPAAAVAVLQANAARYGK